MDENKKLYDEMFDIVEKIEKETLESDFFSEEEIQKRIKNFSDSENKMDIYDTFSCHSQEINHYIAIFSVNLLTYLIQEGYLCRPESNG